MQKQLTHIMLDLETLGTRADSVIMSIGAVKFDPHSDFISDVGFYSSVSIASNLEAHRHVSEDTMRWWIQQSPEAQKVFEEPKVSLASALDGLHAFFDHPNYCVWSNGADFDIPMVGHAFSTHGLVVPWKFWNNRCFRTMKTLAVAKNIPKPQVLFAHNALNDAINQAMQLQAIYKSMKGIV